MDSDTPVPQLDRLVARWIIPAALCLIFLALGAAVINDTLYYSPDSADYLQWARSLAAGKGFRLPLQAEPQRYVFNAPLYPVLLAPAAAIFPYSIPAAKAFTLLFGALTLVVFYRMVLKGTGPVIAAGAALVLACSPLMLLYSTQVLSDIPFALSVLLFFLLASRMERGTDRRWVFPAFVVTTAAAMLLREGGIVLLVGATVWFARRREYRPMLILLTCCLLLYLAWFIRNEIAVAPSESVGIRNMKVVFSHFLTSDEAGMVEEIAARVRSAGAFYGSLLGGLLLLPQHAGMIYDVVRSDFPYFQNVRDLGAWLLGPVSVLTLGLAAYGFVLLVRRSRLAMLLLLTVILYAVVLLIYPITDIRFLFPILLLEAYLTTTAVRAIVLLAKTLTPPLRIASIAGGCLLALFCMLPNVFWLADFVSTSHQYSRSPEGLYASMVSQENYPGEFAKLFPVAMQWVVQHTDSSAVIGCHHAEVALWGRGRKVIDAPPLMTPDAFETLIRDYRIPFIVSLDDQMGTNEYVLLLPAVRRYRFETVFRAGDVEVLRVLPYGHPSGTGMAEMAPAADSTAGIIGRAPGRVAVRLLFTSAVRLMYSGKEQDALEVFRRLRQFDRIALPATYCAGVAAELSSRLDEAMRTFDALHAYPQSGSYLKAAKYHLEIINMLRQAAAAVDPGEKASLHQTVSLAYWDLGFRQQAMAEFGQAVAADSDYFPSAVFGAFYNLNLGDTTAARWYADRAVRLKPGQSISLSLRAVFSAFDSLRVERSAEERAARRLDIAREYRTMGLNDQAIDETLDVLRVSPADTAALRFLADLYTAKQRYAPAVEALKRFVSLAPSDAGARADLKRLEALW